MVANELAQADGFQPFMLAITRQGAGVMRKSGPGAASPDEPAVVESLELAQDAEELRARVTVMDVEAHEPFNGDAIKLLLEHSEGLAINILVPYSIAEQGATIDIEAANAVGTEPRLWPPVGA
ncbi:hypothetical protein [Mycobacteroides franklinii]|uniref:hypothetical protein n=1 Tax=Mycobacteroides franklinii TaxID=948102 RepID=UPI001E486536|nr:hypothetical protein [Mycobacteroides franklinii]